MILSITVYTGTAILMAWLGWLVSQREQRVMRQGGAELSLVAWEIMAAIALYVIVSSLRWLTSWDYNMYYNYYVTMQSMGESSRENFEPGFMLITQAMARSGLHFAFYFAFWALLQIGLLYYSLRHRKVLLPWIALCIFTGPYYVQWMSTLRQAVVECLFVLMVELIVRRKFWIYLLLSLLAMTLHKMSIVLIPLYFVPLIKVRIAKRWMPMALLILCVVLGSFPQWIQLMFDHLGRFAELLGYGHYYRLFTTNSMYAFRSVIGPTRLCPLISGFILIWYYPEIKRMFHHDRYMPALYRFTLLHLAYLNLMANTTQYLSRPGDLMRGCFLIMVCYTMHYLWRERKWLPLVVMALCNFHYIYYEIIKAVVKTGSIYEPELYHTFLF
ncbi:MAG: EpsG family protein [Muribaculaceae bacterium]|nr:EpsG family protein [Muribaculaceae bacterium]